MGNALKLSAVLFCGLACCLTIQLQGQVTPTLPKSNETNQERANQERLNKLLSGSDASAAPITTLPPSKLGFVWTKLYGIEAEGAKFVYVFDRSASMSIARGKPLAAAKRELIASLAPLERVHQFYLIFYNQEARAFQPGAEAGKLIFATDTNKTAAERFINGIQPEGATDHYIALSLALKMRPDVIFLLTDGDAKDDLSEAELAQLAKQNATATKIHVIQFTADLPTGANLKTLAKDNGGEFKTVPLKELAGEK
jgi:hypothetical protein